MTDVQTKSATRAGWWMTGPTPRVVWTAPWESATHLYHGVPALPGPGDWRRSAEGGSSKAEPPSSSPAEFLLAPVDSAPATLPRPRGSGHDQVARCRWRGPCKLCPLSSTATERGVARWPGAPTEVDRKQLASPGRSRRWGVGPLVPLLHPRDCEPRHDRRRPGDLLRWGERERQVNARRGDRSPSRSECRRRES